jgi:hypothetical protein
MMMAMLLANSGYASGGAIPQTNPLESGYCQHGSFSLFTRYARARDLDTRGRLAVWPSSQHMPLFTRFRQALGESRPLIEAPGHVVSASDSGDAVSVIATLLLFPWDCYGISASGRDAFYISHDEFCFSPAATHPLRHR